MKIGIVTELASMVDHYSLTSVVKSQIMMAHAAGHSVVLITKEGFDWKGAPDWLEVRKVFPSYNKVDYMSNVLSPEHSVLIAPMAESLCKAVSDLDAMFTHDLIFTGWNLPEGTAVRLIANKVLGFWMHWVHSVPGGCRDYWTMPDNSVIVYPNHTDRMRCASNFKVTTDDVCVIPHCADPRDTSIKTKTASNWISKYDLLSADMIQVYPIPTDRGVEKGVAQTIEIFGCLKRLGKNVRLVIPNAWCNVDKWISRVHGWRAQASRVGLSDKEVIFTSIEPNEYIDEIPDIQQGIPRSVIDDLLRISNLFICPTQSETFGLSLAEAALSGCLLVLNDDLPMMKEVCGGHGNAIWRKFSSIFSVTVYNYGNAAFYEETAKLIVHTFDQIPCIKSKTYYQQKYRREAVWSLIEGAILKFRSSEVV